MHPVRGRRVWAIIIMMWALQIPATAAADVIVLDDGQRIETPRAIVEGTQVYYSQDDEVHAVPHARVREIHRSGSGAEAPSPSGGTVPAPYYRLTFTDGRQVRIDDYVDGEGVIYYTKYEVRVTIDKHDIHSIIRISNEGEAVVFRWAGRSEPVAADYQTGEEETLYRMSEESRDRALYNAIVDDTAIADAAQKAKADEGARCAYQCLQQMLACRRKCAEVLETLKARQLAENDPAYLMVKNEVVGPCARDCVTAETSCKNDCAESPGP